MFFKMAWRNIWRNKRSTIITLIVISLGCTFMLFMICGSIGYRKGAITNSVKAGTGHVQIHREGFFRIFTPRYHMQYDAEVLKILDQEPEIHSYSLRIKSPGLVSHATKGQNVTVIGIQPEPESKVSVFQDTIAQKGPLLTGRYLLPDDWEMGYPNGDNSKEFKLPGLLIGYKIAKKFKFLDKNDQMRYRRDVVLMVQSITGELKQQLFRVCGVFRTLLPEYDEGTAIIHYKTAQQMFGYDQGNYLSEIAILAKNNDCRFDLTKRLEAKLKPKGYEVLVWDDVSRSIVEFITMDTFFVFLFVGILFVVVAIGLLITLLASIFERLREFGIMRAIGMSPGRLVMLILCESFWTVLLGIILGCIISTPILYLYHVYGIDMAWFMEEGISLWAISLDSTVYAEVQAWPVFLCLAFLMVFTLLVSLYPAVKACRIKVVEAINFV